MKNVISVFLLLAVLLSAFSLPMSAQSAEASSNIDATGETAEAVSKDLQTHTDDMVSYSCVYDTEAKRVRLIGTLNSDLFANQSDSVLVVFAVPPGETEYEALESDKNQPLAEAPVSIKFEFSFKATDIIDRYSRYAVFLRSSNGEYTLTTEAQYPEIESTFEPDSDKTHYKGIVSEYCSELTEIGPGSAIIPIYLDSLFSETASSNLFVGGNGEQFFFDRAAIDALDIAIRSLSVSNTKIYLRFLKSSGSGGSLSSNIKYRMPDVYDAEIIKKIHSLVTFLTDRYTGETSNISGFIIGKGWDNPDKYNYSPNVSLEEYVDRCVAYTVLIANAARNVDPSIDIVLPFTGEGFSEKTENSVTTASTQKNKFTTIVESLLEKLDARVHGGINCSFLIDSHETPLGITNENINQGIDTKYSNPNGLFYAGNQREFSAYLSTISDKYRSAPEKYVFVWSPKKTLGGNALNSAYVYSYYTLLSDSKISFFAIDFADNDNASSINDLTYIMKYIDTDKSLEITKNLAELSGKSSWLDIVSASENASHGVKTVYNAAVDINSATKYRGEFAYFDFSNSNLTENWYDGMGCKNIKIDYKEAGEKSLHADLALTNTFHASELVYIYGYPENMIYTPFLRFRFHIADASFDSLYEVKFIFGSEENRAESSVLVKGDTATDVTVDLSEYVHEYMIDSIRISVRSLDGANSECCFWLYDIVGFSNNYSSGQLSDLILLERDKIRHPTEEEEQGSFIGKVAIPVAIVIVTGAIGFGLFASFKREDKGSDSDDDQQ